MITSLSADKLQAPSKLGNMATPQALSPPPVQALTGVRGLAVLLIVCNHVWLSTHRLSHFVDRLHAAEALWIGVDLFFVLSGFLLTRMLLHSLGGANYYRNFFARRCLRIFPPYFTMIGVLGIAALFLPRTHCSCTDPHNFIWAATFTVNILLFLKHNWSFYLAGILCNHLWSVCVEEHFYVFWPLFVQKLGARRLITGCAVGMLACVILRSWYFAVTHDITGVSVFTPFRLDGFFAGAIVAAMLFSMQGDKAQMTCKRYLLISAPAAILLAACTHLFRGNWVVSTVGYPLIAISFACLIGVLASSNGRSKFDRLFTRGELLFLGKYSYAIYLFHLPIAMLINRELPKHNLVSPLSIAVLGIALPLLITIGLSLLSWHLIEKRFLALRPKFAN